MPGHRQSGADGEYQRGERADDGDDLEQRDAHPEQEPVGLADEEERRRDDGGDDRDQEQLAAHEGAELEVDQLPRVAHLLPLRPRNEARHEVDEAVALEDPVRRRREGEEDADEDLQRFFAGAQRRMDELADRGQMAESPLQPVEDLLLDARVLRRRGG